ncbi:MAG: hypothetical protein ACOC5S_04530 [Acidobacteriota bacterium]
MKKGLIVILMLIFLASLSFSWEKGSAGLNMRVSRSPRVGMTYHLSEKFALRLSIGFSIANEESETEYRPLVDMPYISGERETDTTSVAFGLGILFYFYSDRDFSVYSGINFDYSRVNRDISFSWGDGSVDENGETYQTSAMLGLQYQIMDNLGLYGEVGLGYTHGLFSEDNSIETDTKTNRWGIVNSGIGLVFYF